MTFNFKEIVDNVLKESVSRLVYHFTSLRNFLSIVGQNKINMSKSNGYDEEHSYGYPYFLSTTRVRDARFGYSNGFVVRLTFDGERLNNRYKARPVSFFSEKGARSPKQRYISKLTKDVRNNPDSFFSGARAVRMPDVESEDRILSNKPYIENIFKYIVRVDILFDLDTITKFGAEFNCYYDIPKVLNNNLCADKIFVYGTFDDFNRQKNPINDKVEQILGMLTYDTTEEDRNRLKMAAGLA